MSGCLSFCKALEALPETLYESLYSVFCRIISHRASTTKKQQDSNRLDNM